MGRNKNRKKKSKSGVAEGIAHVADGDAATSKSTKAPEYSTTDLLVKAEENMDLSNFEAARLFCKRAIELEPESLRGLEMLASICLETGNVEEAKECLVKAVQLSPDDGHSKYMSLGEIETGQTSLKHYQKGIELISKAIETLAPVKDSDTQRSGLAREMSTGYCSMAEIYMSDLCFEDDAENKCFTLIEKAITSDQTNPEAYQLMASFHLVKDDTEHAKEMIQKSLSLWLPKYEALRGWRVELEPDEETQVDVSCPVSYPARINAVKTLIELEMYDDAATILEGLIEDDDEVVYVWYLLGWMNYLRGDDFFGNARFYLRKCKEVESKVGTDDIEMVAHVQELLTELGPGPEDDDDNDEVDEDDAGSEEIVSSDDEEEPMET